MAERDEKYGRERSERSREETSRLINQGGVRNITAYPAGGILATLPGHGPVKLVAAGDHQEASPVCQFIGQNRKLRWEVQDEFIIVDPAYIPPTQEQLETMLRDVRK